MDWIVENGDIKYIDGAIIFDVDHEELWNRLDARGRSDDTREAAEVRWGIFEQNIYSMSETLKANNVKMTHVDGVGPVEEVTARLEKILRDWGIIKAQEGQPE